MRGKNAEGKIGLCEELRDGSIPALLQTNHDGVAVGRLQRRHAPVGIFGFDRIARVDDRAKRKRDVRRRQFASVGEPNPVAKMVDDGLAVGGDVAVRVRRHASQEHGHELVIGGEADQRLRDEQIVADGILIVRQQRIERRRIDVVGDPQHVRLRGPAGARARRQRQRKNDDSFAAHHSGRTRSATLMRGPTAARVLGMPWS